MQLKGEARTSSIDALTSLSRKMTVVGSGASMLLTIEYADLRSDTTPVGGLAMRSNEAFTSTEVSGEPS